MHETHTYSLSESLQLRTSLYMVGHQRCLCRKSPLLSVRLSLAWGSLSVLYPTISLDALKVFGKYFSISVSGRTRLFEEPGFLVSLQFWNIPIVSILTIDSISQASTDNQLEINSLGSLLPLALFALSVYKIAIYHFDDVTICSSVLAPRTFLITFATCSFTGCNYHQNEFYKCPPNCEPDQDLIEPLSPKSSVEIV